MLTTSNFAKSAKNPNAIAISQGLPRFAPRVKRYLPLAPPRALLNAKDPALYDVEYKKILAALDPKKVYDDLIALGGPDAVLLCWESFNVKCHRRLVAEWIEAALGIVIPELGHERAESIAYDSQVSKWSTQKAEVKEQSTAQFLLNL